MANVHDSQLSGDVLHPVPTVEIREGSIMRLLALQGQEHRLVVRDDLVEPGNFFLEVCLCLRPLVF